jgi:hypothetical protein
MTQSLAKYHSRSPRYILQPQDNTLVRVAGPQQTPWEEGTEIQNISLSGLAFTAPHDLCPLVGEIIKIQFQVPSSHEMACYGLVTRIEAISGSQMIVAIQFHKLEMSQRIVLLQGLAQKLKEQIEVQERQPKKGFAQILFSHWKESAVIISFLMFWILLTLWALSYLGQRMN